MRRSCSLNILSLKDTSFLPRILTVESSHAIAEAFDLPGTSLAVVIRVVSGHQTEAGSCCFGIAPWLASEGRRFCCIMRVLSAVSFSSGGSSAGPKVRGPASV